MPVAKFYWFCVNKLRAPAISAFSDGKSSHTSSPAAVLPAGPAHSRTPDAYLWPTQAAAHLYWDAGGGEFIALRVWNHRLIVSIAVTPDEAARSLASFVDDFDISKTGEFWAPRGPGYGWSFLQMSNANLLQGHWNCRASIGGELVDPVASTVVDWTYMSTGDSYTHQLSSKLSNISTLTAV